MTFDVLRTVHVHQEHGWLNWFETFSVCRNCKRTTVFLISQKEYKFQEHPHQMSPEKIDASLNPHFKVARYINLTDNAQVRAPDHTPPDIAKVFAEAATCLANECWNATGAMLRLSIDLATKGLLPLEEVEGLNAYARKNLAPRLAWLIDHQILPEALRDLSSCIREDGNDAAHDGSLQKADAQDLLDFTIALLERVYTEPERLKLARERRDARRKPEKP
jgi:hypothetical protein